MGHRLSGFRRGGTGDDTGRHGYEGKTLMAQLAQVGVKPSDIRFVAVSHTHGDHVGNVDLFPESTLLIQQAELDWAFAPDKYLTR